MNTTCKTRLSQFWSYLQHDLFPFLREEDHLALSPALEKVIRVLEFTEIERFPGRSDSCRAGFAPAERQRLITAHNNSSSNFKPMRI